MRLPRHSPFYAHCSVRVFYWIGDCCELCNMSCSTIPLQVATNGNTASGLVLLVSDQNKNKSILICTYSICGSVFMVYMGHLYIWAMVIVIQMIMETELFNLLYVV